MDSAKTLVVDDDKELAKAIVNNYLLEGYEVRKAYNGLLFRRGKCRM